MMDFHVIIRGREKFVPALFKLLLTFLFKTPNPDYTIKLYIVHSDFAEMYTAIVIDSIYTEYQN